MQNLPLTKEGDFVVKGYVESKRGFTPPDSLFYLQGNLSVRCVSSNFES
jgi:hypothetical protein